MALGSDLTLLQCASHKDETMKAVIYEAYGPPEVLRLTEIEKPTPKPNEVLVRVRATTVTIGDCRMRAFDVPRGQWLPARLYLGIFKPRRRILGMEIAGDIEAVGKDVTHFQPGDAIMASTFSVGFGGYAEYICLPEDGIIAPKPENLTYEEAAAVYGGGVTALKLLRQANIQPDQQVLVYGASGAVGTNAVQIAKNYYNAVVTGVCSTRNLELVQSLGADAVVDYTKDDFTQQGVEYDVVLDAVAKFPPAQAKTALKPGGVYLNAHNHSNGGEKREDLFELIDLIDTGKLKPVVDRCYPLEDIVEAHRYVSTGRKRGNVAVTIQ
jgi:NADPH:quinone reductase-like Zn-dependent oxidoreductase